MKAKGGYVTGDELDRKREGAVCVCECVCVCASVPWRERERERVRVSKTLIQGQQTNLLFRSILFASTKFLWEPVSAFSSSEVDSTNKNFSKL